MQEASATVDLGEVKAVGSVAAHLWSAPGWGAPFPKVTVALSESGQDFVEAAATTATDQGYLEPPGWPRVDWFVLPHLGKRARYVKCTFRFAPGGLHLAVDEVAVYGQ